MKEKIIQIISDYQGVDSKIINEESELINDIGLSSFDVLSLICKFETEFDIEISDREIKNFKTIKDIVNFINDKKNKGE